VTLVVLSHDTEKPDPDLPAEVDRATNSAFEQMQRAQPVIDTGDARDREGEWALHPTGPPGAGTGCGSPNLGSSSPAPTVLKFLKITTTAPRTITRGDWVIRR
jgi:hypothetical protein